MSEKGRSMVEMLGVLAIIGVLSVGAIAGYSKAMFKYKLNKFSESMNLLINNALQISRSLPKDTVSGKDVYYAEIFYKMKLLPDGITYDGTVFLKDVFNNRIWPYSYPSFYGIGYGFKNKDNIIDICHNLLNIYKENRHELLYIVTDQLASEEEHFTGSDLIYGDQYCTGNRKCLKNLTLEDIYTLCNNCDQNAVSCRFYATWK